MAPLITPFWRLILVRCNSVSRTIVYGFLAVATLAFAGYSGIQVFGTGLAIGGLRGVVGRETQLHHYATLQWIWFVTGILSLVVCVLFVRVAVRASRSSGRYSIFKQHLTNQ